MATVTRIARSICSEINPDSVPDAVQCMASFGGGGRLARNDERDLMSWCANLYQNNLEPYMLHLDMLNPDQGPAQKINIPVLIPYEVMHALYQQGAQQFTLSMLGEGGPEGIKTFWEDAKGEEWAQCHPLVRHKVRQRLGEVRVLARLCCDGRCSEHAHTHHLLFGVI